MQTNIEELLEGICQQTRPPLLITTAYLNLLIHWKEDDGTYI